MDFFNWFSADQSGSNVMGSSVSSDMPMNSLFQQSSMNQTYAKERDDSVVVGGLLLAFALLCIFVVRRLQNS